MSSATADIDEASTGRDTRFPFVLVDLPDASSADDATTDASRAYCNIPEIWRSDTSYRPVGSHKLSCNKATVLSTFVIRNPFWLDKTNVQKRCVFFLSEKVPDDTFITPISFNISGGSALEETISDTTIHWFSVDTSKADIEVTELVSAFLEDVQTDEAQERYEIAISEIIDKYGQVGIASVQKKLLGQPALERLFRRFLTALGACRGQPIDDIAKQILLRHLHSMSAGRRSAAASALGSFPESAVLAALQRRAAVEKNRMVLATLNAHIRTLTRDGLPAPKIL